MFRSLARTAALAALTLYMALTPGQLSAQALEQLEITTKGGVRVFEVEMADTEPKRRVGLMHRKELADGKGMLFDFGRVQPIAMWMQNTYVSLDMIFIREDGTIANIAENTTPLSERSIFSAGSVKSVLEVVAGTAKRYGIAPGDTVSHRIFRKR
jgi:uncharacterized membrane protein (UPF0127 family)